MYPLTRDVPKPLLPIRGGESTILDDLVDQLVSKGSVCDVTVVSNARFVTHFQAWSDEAVARHPDLRIAVLNDGALDDARRLGAARDLAFAVEARAPREALVVAAGDNLFRFDMARFFSDYRSRRRSLVLRYREPDVSRLRRTGVAEIDEAGRLLRLVEKPETPPSSWACPAFYLLEPDALSLLPEFLDEADDTDAVGRFIAWLCRRREVFTFEMRGRRLDVGNREDYERAEAWLAANGTDEHP